MIDDAAGVRLKGFLLLRQLRQARLSTLHALLHGREMLTCCWSACSWPRAADA